MDPRHTHGHTVLCVDDEQNILNALKRLLRKEPYRLLTCDSGKEGLEILAGNEVHVVISDQRMPGMSGTDFLRQVKESHPNVIRIILTGYTDVDSITQSINEGHIYKFFLKPWNDQHLTLEIRQALEQHDLIRENQRLYDMTIQQNAELKEINENLETIVEERTQSLEMQNRALQLSHAMLEDLPMPIVGISAELIIVFVNRAAKELLAAEGPIEFGAPVLNYFDGLTEDLLLGTMSKQEPRRTAGRGTNSRSKYDLTLVPLSGQFRGSGLIMSVAL